MRRTSMPYNFRFPREYITRDRFEAIFWSLHLCDITDKENQKKKGTTQYDRLLKIKPLYDQVLTACRAHYQPGREISIDERMIASKTRIRFRQYMEDKPSNLASNCLCWQNRRWGIHGNFFLYKGKSGATKEEELSQKSVMNLLLLQLLGKGYHLYVDNFYTSPALFTKLSAKGLCACGTIRQTSNNDVPKKAVRGDLRWLRKDSLLFVKWKSTREVTLCSTFHTAYTGKTVRRRVKEAGRWQVRDIPTPDVVIDYNRYMGGVDLSDALIQYYSVLGKTMHWYKTLFFHFLDIAIVNAFILHKDLAFQREETPLLQKQFRELLLKELLEESKTVDKPGSCSSSACMPAYYGQTATENRKHCVLCRTKGKKAKMPIYCTKCNISLCLTSTRNCFVEHYTHTVVSVFSLFLV
ncbi:hypothetical protein LDENG_00190600 [Lucifuga dentata]|nr:hypothetical protein LDENG_00190600 [Lucifuga dentata]